MQRLVILTVCFWILASCNQQEHSPAAGKNFVVLDSTASLQEIVQAAAQLRPSPRQTNDVSPDIWKDLKKRKPEKFVKNKQTGFIQNKHFLQKGIA